MTKKKRYGCLNDLIEHETGRTGRLPSPDVSVQLSHCSILTFPVQYFKNWSCMVTNLKTSIPIRFLVKSLNHVTMTPTSTAFFLTPER